MGQRSDFSRPRQGAEEKSANATRKAAHSAVSKATVRLCLARGSQRLGMSTKKDADHSVWGFFCGGRYRARTATTTTAACGRNREELLGQRSDFSRPRQGAEEKSANATRKAAHSAVSKATVRLCLARGSQRLGMSTKKDADHLVWGFFCGGRYRARTATTTTAACGRNREELLGQRSDFSRPRQGAEEKSANATRKAAHSAVSKATVRLCLARGSQRLGMSTKKDADHLVWGFFVVDGTGLQRPYLLGNRSPCIHRHSDFRPDGKRIPRIKKRQVSPKSRDLSLLYFCTLQR